MSHTIAEAMKRGELDEEEAYFILRFAGHHGYREAIRRLTPEGRLWHARRWLIWFGGWERPHLIQWDAGKPAFEMKGDPTPVGLFGHRFTHYGWGWQLRTRTGFLVYSRARPNRDAEFYWSPDGTPSHPGAVLFYGNERAFRAAQANRAHNEASPE